MKPSFVFVLAVLAAACQHTGDPPAGVAPTQSAARPPAKAPPAKVEPDEGEQRAGIAAGHRLGTPGPAIVLKPLDGEAIDLAKVYGAKPVYLKFWATWCIPCREQMPAFERIYEALGDRMQVIAVNAGMDDDEASVRAFRAQYGLRMPIVVDDGRLAAALDLQVTPQHVLIGRDARIAYVGHLDGPKLDQAIEQVLAAPAPAVAPAGQQVVVRPAFRVGDLVPAVNVTTVDGKARVVGGAGRPRAVVLFSAFCESYLKDSVPQTSQACRRVREEIEPLLGGGDVAGTVEWLGLVQGLWTSTESVTKYQVKTGTKLPLVLDADGALFRAFGVHHIPTVVLLDRDGRVVRVFGPDDRGLTEAAQALGRGGK